MQPRGGKAISQCLKTREVNETRSKAARRKIHTIQLELNFFDVGALSNICAAFLKPLSSLVFIVELLSFWKMNAAG
jgi:hypothetical protein